MTKLSIFYILKLLWSVRLQISMKGECEFSRSWIELRDALNFVNGAAVNCACNLMCKYFVRLSVCPSVRLSVCPSVRLSVCPSVRLSVCPSPVLTKEEHQQFEEEEQVKEEGLDYKCLFKANLVPLENKRETERGPFPEYVQLLNGHNQCWF
jgi:hypothetical protein